LACLPSFIIAGFQKGGTTALGALLDAHPNIVMASIKEAHFFDKKKNYSKGLQQYASQFQQLPQIAAANSSSKAIAETFITGEATPFYLADKHACARMRQTLPHIRLLVMVRDPVARAYSEYQVS
jgi:Sulfotransferase domain